MNRTFVIRPLGGLRGVPVGCQPDRLKAGLQTRSGAGSWPESRSEWNQRLPTARGVGSRIRYREMRDLPIAGILNLYKANGWSSARKPGKLRRALMHSHALVSAWDGNQLVGLGNALSDGHLVVYYSHLLVLSGYQRRGIGRRIMRMLKAKCRKFHQHVLLADARSVGFYKKFGFERAGRTQPMWIHAGHDHGHPDHRGH